jgi:CDK inhibitor PHO81
LTAEADAARCPVLDDQGEYINLVVQVTRDLVPVVYSLWALPVDGFQLGVTDVDFNQFNQLAKRRGADVDMLVKGLDGTSPATDWHRAIASSMAPLERVLAVRSVERVTRTASTSFAD